MTHAQSMTRTKTYFVKNWIGWYVSKGDGNRWLRYRNHPAVYSTASREEATMRAKALRATRQFSGLNQCRVVSVRS